MPAELTGMITRPQALPPGRGLDMGSGEGSKAIFMAQHGWPMTAVENVPRAMAEARRRASEAGVTIDSHQDDATRLDELKLEPG